MATKSSGADAAAAKSTVPRNMVPNAGRKHFMKVVVIGDSFVGKTALIQMFNNGSFKETSKPTIGADFSNKEISLDNGGTVVLQIWDTAGQERFMSLS